jgi:hypothetical protein
VWTKNSEEILEKAQILVHIRSLLQHMQSIIRLCKATQKWTLKLPIPTAKIESHR